MFGQDKNSLNSSNRKSASAKDVGVTILTAGCHFTGKLVCRGATRIGGAIEGQIIAEGLLVIEEDAIVNGNIDAEEVVIHGKVDGQIQGRKRIEMCAKAEVTADILTPSLVVHDGALFNGKTIMKSATTRSHSQDNKHQITGGDGSSKIGASLKDEKSTSNVMPEIKAARFQDRDLELGLDPEPSLS
jgi:cytoskeletal protein CcmA (bactofilin family)